MADTRDQTLTQVQSPLSPGRAARPRRAAGIGQRRSRPAWPRARAFRSSATSCTSGARADGAARAGERARCWTTGWSPASTRASCAARAASISRTSAARTAPSSTTCAPRAATRLRDGALVFVGNHVGVFRMVSAIELEAIKAELVVAAGAGADRVARRWRVACDRLRRLAAVRRRAVHRRRDRRRQGGLRARRPRGERAQGPVRRHQLRRDPARAGRERAVRLPRGRALDGAPRRRPASSRRPRAARCSSTRSARCRRRRRSSCCASCRTAS